MLLVEDDPAVRELARRVLDRRGFDVAAVPSPEAALDAAARGTIGVLLTDVVLPGMAGPALAKRLGETHPGLRVIFTSGYPESVIRSEHPIPDGALFLEKPFTPDQLLASVDQALGAGDGLVA